MFYSGAWLLSDLNPFRQNTFYNIIERRARPTFPGLVQVKQPHQHYMNQKLAYDIEYVNNMSFAGEAHLLPVRLEGAGQGRCGVT